MRLFVRNRKGSLSLSMEAIVILILAVVMLGLGLTFVRIMFKDITDKAKKSVDIADLTAKPTESDPVTLSPSRPEIKEDKQGEVIVGFYNPSTTKTRWMLQIIDNSISGGQACGGLTTTTAICYGYAVGTSTQGGFKTIYNDQPFALSKDQMIAWNMIFQPQTGTTQGEPTSAALLTVQFCSVADGSTVCETTTDSEVYQTELYLTVRK